MNETYCYLDIENRLSGPLMVTGWTLGDDPVMQDERGVQVELESVLADPHIVKVAHSGHDVRHLRKLGYTINGPVEDTMVMAWTINENTPLDLEWCASRYADVEMDKRLTRAEKRVWFEDDSGKKWDIEDSDAWPAEVWDQMLKYNRRDVEALRELHIALRDRLDESMRLEYYLERERPWTGLLRRMEARGLPVNLEETAVLASEVQDLREQSSQELRDLGGLPPSFNLRSQPQLVAYLFSRQFTYTEELDLGATEVECLKSCMDGEHEDCDPGPACDYPTPAMQHVFDLLPEGFIVDKVGRTKVVGHYSLAGRKLRETPPTKDKLTGKVGKLPSTATDVMMYLLGSDPWVQKLCMEWRKYDKLLTTYLEKFPRIAVRDRCQGCEDAPIGQHKLDGERCTATPRIYGRFNQTGTTTGRLSSSDPNMQNMPSRGRLGKKVRHLFQGNLVVGDFDQIEMRIMAHLSQDPNLLKVFRDGGDPHAETTIAVFGDVDVKAIAPGAAASYRDVGKQLNYAMGYGAMAKRIAQTLSLFGFPTSVEVADGYLAELMRHYRRYFEWKEEAIAIGKKRGYVDTIGGHRRHLRSQFADTANWRLVGYGERQIISSLVQGSAADIIKCGMLIAEEEFPELLALAQIHDEAVWQYLDRPSREMLAQLQVTMEVGHGFDLSVPMGFEPVVCDNWGEKSTGGADWWAEGELDGADLVS